MLTALTWAYRYTKADFALKLDTDALVIGPFAEAIRSLFASSPDTGILGTIGVSCNPDVQPLQDPRREPDLLRLRRLLPRLPDFGEALESVRIDGLGLVPVELLRSFAMIRSHVDSAVANGYRTSEYCQGGAYAISREMVRRMVSLGYVAQSQPWMWLPVGEDMAMSMYARAVGLSLRDASCPGQPFGVQSAALPYSPQRLVDLGYSIIHSVRNDPVHSEEDILRFFRMRQQENGCA